MSGKPSASAVRAMERAMRRHLAGGWIRGVFGGRDPVRIHPASGGGTGGTPSHEELDAAVAAARAAAQTGRLRHTWVLDPRTRVRIDARMGRARRVVRDDRALTKMMGGKDRFLRPDRSFALLSALEILGPDGSLCVRHARKYKQVEHFAAICRPIYRRLAAGVDGPLRVADLACGNGHLTLALAEALHLDAIPARLLGVEQDPGRVAAAAEKAAALPGREVQFAAGTIADMDPEKVLGGSPHLVVALHACDTATCDALVRGLAWRARAILLAPCCQAQLRRNMDPDGVPVPALATGLLADAYAASLTDALRVEILRAVGYDTDTLAFVAGTHSAKNLLIRAVADRPPPWSDVARRVAPVAARARELGVRLHSLDAIYAEMP